MSTSSSSQSKLPSSETTDSHLHDRMIAAREAFLNKDETHYLGTSTARDNLAWTRRGRADVLIDKKAADDAEQARKSESLTQSDNAPTAEPPEPAVLTAVVTITQDDYWLTSCGMWKGPTTAAPHLADVKPTCTGGKPEHHVFATDYPAVLENIKHLMDQVKTPGFKATQGVLIHPNARDGVKLKFRHIFFEALPSEDDEENADKRSDTVSESEDLPVEFTIQGWPAEYDEARKALQDMVTTHRVRPLQAFDSKGQIIKPAEYRKRLQGAMVFIGFTMTHYSIAAKPDKNREAIDTYVADIEFIRVLIPPNPTGPITPKKKRTYMVDPYTPDFEGSPTKKKKTARGAGGPSSTRR